ncbi:MAG: hypothetical protein ACOYYF_15205 [Chloroflexota bacterium]|nr:hypothetical protein [Chloroflexota bacterium]MBI5701995.1 hypothetical protein [Chloroflexota bacterium]
MSYAKFYGFLIAATMLFLAACGGKTADTNGPVEVKVRLGEFFVESSVTEFKPNVQYHFIVTNEGVVPHEFMIMPVEMGGMGMGGMSMEEKDARAFMMIPEEDLPPGATVEMDYTFTSVPEGNIEFVCALPGHFEAGMHSPLTIK